MAKLKTKTGCRTCLVRKKKCPEDFPQCTECRRLGLVCIQRTEKSNDAGSAVSLTNMRTRNTVMQPAISNGYPAFRNALEKRLTEASPAIFHPLLWRLSDPGFKDFKLFGRFCTQNLLVREAIVAFAAYGQGPSDGNSYKVALSSYQSCISRLRQTETQLHRDPTERDLLLTAIMFLGLLEGLRIGDPRHCVAHFKACKRLLSEAVSGPALRRDPVRLRLHQIVAECIIYNLATMSAFEAHVCHVMDDCGDGLDGLFREDDPSCSPFLGGNRRMYRAMFKVNRLLCQIQPNPKDCPRPHTFGEDVQVASLELSKLDQFSQSLYSVPSMNPEAKDPYMAINRVTTCALKIQLAKISDPWLLALDMAIRPHLLESIAVLEQQDVRISGNPALRWPFTILACAVATDEEFDFIKLEMEEMEKIVDPANVQKSREAVNVIRRVRWDLKSGRSLVCACGLQLTSTLDLLLEPTKLSGNSALLAH